MVRNTDNYTEIFHFLIIPGIFMSIPDHTLNTLSLIPNYIMKSPIFVNKKEQLRSDSQLHILMSTECLKLANALLDEINDISDHKDISFDEMKNLSQEELAERIVSTQISQIECKARLNVAHELKKLSDKYSRKKTEIDKQIERMK